MISLNISVPKRDIETLSETFKRYVAYYKGNTSKAIEKTCVQLVKSLRGSTNVGDKLRKVVRNPNRYNASTRQSNKYLKIHDKIKAYYETRGSVKHSGRTQAWLPRLNQIRNREKADRWAIEKFTQRKGKKYVPIYTQREKPLKKDAELIAWMVLRKQLEIGRRGLAKSSWGWMLSKLKSSASVNQPEISGITEAHKGTQPMGAFTYEFIEMKNKLSYIRKSLKDNLSSLLSRTSNQMRRDMGEIHGKSAQQAGLRAA